MDSKNTQTPDRQTDRQAVEKGKREWYMPACLKKRIDGKRPVNCKQINTPPEKPHVRFQLLCVFSLFPSVFSTVRLCEPTMGETGIARFAGNLDPRAQEFRPRNPNNHAQLALFRPPLPQPLPQVYYPYASPYVPTTEVQVQVVSFCDAGGLGYSCASPVYVSAPEVRVPGPVQAGSAAATRTLVLSSVPGDVSEGIVRRELGAFGEVRGVQMERIREGIVTIHFYDLRHAEEALREIRDQHMQQQARLRNHYYNSTTALLVANSVSQVDNSGAPLPPLARGLIAGRAVWAQFIIPSATNAVPDGHNQGTIVIFNLDPEVSKSALKEIFEAFGI